MQEGGFGYFTVMSNGLARLIVPPIDIKANKVAGRTASPLK